MENLREELLNKKVSYQPCAWSSSIESEITIREALGWIRNGKYKNEINKLREFLSRGETDLYGMHKIRLPGVTFCGTFGGIRRKEYLNNYNSLLIIDIDKLDNNDLAKTKETLENDKYVATFWDSPSQKGIKGIISLNYKQNIIENKNIIDINHKYAFLKIKTYFQDEYNIDIDTSGSDTTRLCFFSYDPNLLIKTECVKFDIDNPEVDINTIGKITKSDKYKRNGGNTNVFVSRDRLLNPSNRNSPKDRKTIQSIIKYLSKRKLSITNNYTDWYRVALAIANTFTYDIGIKYYLKLCRLDFEKHDEDGSMNLLLYCYNNSRNEIKIGTIIYLAKMKGYNAYSGQTCHPFRFKSATFVFLNVPR